MTEFKAIAALATSIAISISGPAAAENVLRWAREWGASTFDPHSYNHPPTIIQQDPVYERLLTTDARLGVVPSWR